MKLRAVNDNVVVKATTSDDFQKQALTAEVIETVEGVSDVLQGKKVLIPRNKMSLEVPELSEDTTTDTGILIANRTATVIVKLADIVAIVED